MSDHDQQQQAGVPEASIDIESDSSETRSEENEEEDAHPQLDTGKIYEPWLLWIINVYFMGYRYTWVRYYL